MRAVILALLAASALLGACGDDDGGTTPAPGDASPVGGDEEGLVELELTAENTRFDKDRLQAPAGSDVSVILNNKDSVEHNFSLYEAANPTPLSQGVLLPGPAFLAYQFTAPEQAGTYGFQCDVHPAAMAGDFITE